MSENILLYFNSFADIYWHGAVIGLATLAGYLIYLMLSARIMPDSSRSAKLFLPLSYILALFLARVQYCFFRQDEFSGGKKELFNLTDGGYGLFGAMAGVIIALFITCKLYKLDLRRALDCAAVAAAPAVVIGRLANKFSGGELGFEITDENVRKYMFTVFSEKDKAHLITVYTYEAIAAAVVFIITAYMFFAVYKAKKYREGTAAMMFMFYYCIFQALFESWRADSLFLNTLGFVRFSQALAALVFGVMLIVECIRYAKRYGFEKTQIYVWVGLLLLIALAFVCEFTLTADTRMRNYVGMINGLLGTALLGHRIITRTEAADSEIIEE